MGGKLLVEHKKVWGALRFDLPGKEDLIKLLHQVELEAKVFRSESARSLLFHPARRPKIPITYYWLGALVPYTACLKAREPDWNFIQNWLAQKDKDAPDGRKLWREGVELPFKRARKINPNIERLVRAGALEFLRFSRRDITETSDRLHSRWLPEERAYLKALHRTVPVVPRQVASAKDYEAVLRTLS